MTKEYFAYWIRSDNKSYIGATIDPVKRLKQHNSLLSGGAFRTRGRLWTYVCVVSGFRTWREALQFEWAAKYCSKRCRSVETRKAAINELLSRERWTSNAPPAADVPLSVEWHPQRYGLPPDELPVSAGQVPTTRKARPPKRKFKRLHGVAY